MFPDDHDAVPERKVLFREVPDRFLERCLGYVDVSDRSNGPTYVQGVRIPQLHAIIHVGDVVEVWIPDLPQ